MARKMALVPEAWLQRNFGGGAGEGSGGTKPAEITVHEEKNEASLIDVSDLLPKCYRSKARIILHYINDSISLDARQRIVYKDGTVGSHIVDMLRYFVSPFVKERPLDAPKFESLMNHVGVPVSVIAKRQTIPSNWKKY